jgi:hypothetical protein
VAAQEQHSERTPKSPLAVKLTRSADAKEQSAPKGKDSSTRHTETRDAEQHGKAEISKSLARVQPKPNEHQDQQYGRYTILRLEDPKLTEVSLPSNDTQAPTKPEKTARARGPTGTPLRNQPSARCMLAAAATTALTLFAAIQPGQPRLSPAEAKVRVGGSSLDLQAWSEAHLKAQEAEALYLEQRQSRNMAKIWSDLQRKHLSSERADRALAEVIRRDVSATPSCKARREEALAELRGLVTEGITDLRSPLTNLDSANTGLEGIAPAPPDLKELLGQREMRCARVRAAMHESLSSGPTTYELSLFIADKEGRILTRGGKPPSGTFYSDTRLAQAVDTILRYSQLKQRGGKHRPVILTACYITENGQPHFSMLMDESMLALRPYHEQPKIKPKIDSGRPRNRWLLQKEDMGVVLRDADATQKDLVWYQVLERISLDEVTQRQEAAARQAMGDPIHVLSSMGCDLDADGDTDSEGYSSGAEELEEDDEGELDEREDDADGAGPDAHPFDPGGESQTFDPGGAQAFIPEERDGQWEQLLVMTNKEEHDELEEDDSEGSDSEPESTAPKPRKRYKRQTLAQLEEVRRSQPLVSRRCFVSYNNFVEQLPSRQAAFFNQALRVPMYLPKYAHQVETDTDSSKAPEIILDVSHEGVRGLLDTGASCDFITEEMVKEWDLETRKLRRKRQTIIASGEKIETDTEALLAVIIRDSRGKNILIQTWCQIMPGLPADIIIGLPTIITKMGACFMDIVRSLIEKHAEAERTLLVALSAEPETETEALPHPKGVGSDRDWSDDPLMKMLGGEEEGRGAVSPDSDTPECKEGNTEVDETSSVPDQGLRLDEPPPELMPEQREAKTHTIALAEEVWKEIHQLDPELTLDHYAEHLARYDKDQLVRTWLNCEPEIAPEEAEEPMPSDFPYHLSFMESTVAEEQAKYLATYKERLGEEAKERPRTNTLMTTKGLKVFVPTSWEGIRDVVFSINWKADMPTTKKPRARPVNQRLYQNAHLEFKRLCKYMYEVHDGPIASPMVPPRPPTPSSGSAATTGRSTSTWRQATSPSQTCQNFCRGSRESSTTLTWTSPTRFTRSGCTRTQPPSSPS